MDQAVGYSIYTVYISVGLFVGGTLEVPIKSPGPR